jgi:hypothetical protein
MFSHERVSEVCTKMHEAVHQRESIEHVRDTRKRGGGQVSSMLPECIKSKISHIFYFRKNMARGRKTYGGAVAVNPGLGDEAGGASVAGVESNRLKDGEHSAKRTTRGKKNASHTL